MATAEVHGHRPGNTQKSAAPGVVRGMVRTGWGVGRMVRQIWLAGLGAMAATGEEGAHLFQALVERGEEVEPNLQVGWNKLRDEVTSKMQWAGEQARPEAEKISSRLRSMRPADRTEVEKLSRRVEELTARIEEMSRTRPAKAAARKAPAAASRTGQTPTRRTSSRASRESTPRRSRTA